MNSVSVGHCASVSVRPPRRLLACFIALATVSATAKAQDEPAGLVHGLQSNGATWQTAATRLKREFKITPVAPDLNWRDRFGAQSTQLNGLLPAGTRMAMGHSNGGPILRDWNKNYRRNDRIASVGATHRGAQLAENAINGNVYRVGGYIASDIGYAAGYYMHWESRGVDNVVGYSVMWALENLFYFIRDLGSTVAKHGFALGAGTGVAVPVLNDMSPYRSLILPELNSSANLARESQEMVARVGIVSQMPTPINQVFFTLSPGNAPAWAQVREIAYAGALSAYFHYAYFLDEDHPYYEQLRAGAELWAIVAMHMLDIDAWWLFLNGTLLDYERPTLYGYRITYEGSDGIVPVSSQRYPNFTNEYFLVNGPTHMREKTNPAVIDLMVRTFGDDFRAPKRPPGSPARVVLSPTTVSVMLGASVSLTAASFDVDGAPVGSTSVTWQSTNPSVATVSGAGSAGTVTGVAVGTALIVVENQGYADTTSVTVTSTPPLTSVSIVGPTSLDSEEMGYWSAQPSGGATPLSYTWKVNGYAAPDNSAQDFLHEAVGLRMRVSVTVVDATGASVGSTIWVDVRYQQAGPQ